MYYTRSEPARTHLSAATGTTDKLAAFDNHAAAAAAAAAGY